MSQRGLAPAVPGLQGWLCLALAFACGTQERAPRLGPTDNVSVPNGGAFVTTSSGGVAGALAQGGAAAQGGSALAQEQAGAGGSAAGSASAPSAPECIPRAGCQTLCGWLGRDPAACGMGNLSQCPCVCEDRFNGPCPDELDALLACAGSSPDVQCSIRGRVLPGCEAESFDLEVCDARAQEQLCAASVPRCRAYCEPLTLQFCDQGPEMLTSCLCGCESNLSGLCATEFDAFMTCTGDAPSFQCGDDGEPTAASCGTEWRALEACADGSPPRLDAGR